VNLGEILDGIQDSATSQCKRSMRGLFSRKSSISALSIFKAQLDFFGSMNAFVHKLCDIRSSAGTAEVQYQHFTQ
jgi:hypothetical protein